MCSLHAAVGTLILFELGEILNKVISLQRGFSVCDGANPICCLHCLARIHAVKQALWVTVLHCVRTIRDHNAIIISPFMPTKLISQQSKVYNDA